VLFFCYLHHQIHHKIQKSKLIFSQKIVSIFIEGLKLIFSFIHCFYIFCSIIWLFSKSNTRQIMICCSINYSRTKSNPQIWTRSTNILTLYMWNRARQCINAVRYCSVLKFTLIWTIFHKKHLKTKIYLILWVLIFLNQFVILNLNRFGL
jgi:hypothetical protein